MSTSPTILQPAAPKESKWHSILDHVKAFFGIALKDVQKYTPAAANLAEVLFPEYAGMIDADKAIVTGVATTIQNTVLTIEQKYSDATAGETTNAAKLEDALAIIAPMVVPTLNSLKVPVPTTVDSIANKISATVAILKNYTVPVGTPSAIGN